MSHKFLLMHEIANKNKNKNSAKRQHYQTYLVIKQIIKISTVIPADTSGTSISNSTSGHVLYGVQVVCRIKFAIIQGAKFFSIESSAQMKNYVWIIPIRQGSLLIGYTGIFILPIQESSVKIFGIAVQIKQCPPMKLEHIRKPTGKLGRPWQFMRLTFFTGQRSGPYENA